MPLLEIIAVTYRQQYSMYSFIESIRAQTLNDWKLHLIHDGYEPSWAGWTQNYVTDNRIKFWSTHEHKGTWGHYSRKWGIENCLGHCKYVLITNADDYFAPVFIEEMCKGEEDLIYCNCAHHHWGYQARETRLQRKSIDISCCVIKKDLVKEVGWNHFQYAGDWFFLEEIMLKYPEITKRKVGKCLVMKN